MKKKKMPLLCRIGLHWPLNRMRPIFLDNAKDCIVYLCQCNCGKYWLTFGGRYTFFKMGSEGHHWLHAVSEEEELKVDEVEKETE